MQRINSGDRVVYNNPDGYLRIPNGTEGTVIYCDDSLASVKWDNGYVSESNSKRYVTLVPNDPIEPEDWT